MLKILKAADRGYADHGWLKTFHSFSFADYRNENYMGFGDLRVVNEDRITGGTGFAEHGHRDIEIISYVIEGALEHRDSMGNATVIRPGEVQRMSAGTGIRHSEKNHFADQTTHFLQIWVIPDRIGHTPGYGQKSFDENFKTTDFVLVASGEGREGSVSLNQDADFYLAKSIKNGQKIFPIRQGRKVWVQMIRGSLSVNEINLSTGDGLAIEDEKELLLQWSPDTQFLLIDLP